ncbi:site-specific integrase [Neobacillus pocheonensis]|uniref:Site-specific integrase n=1 Tax=Neobacillus pocheonensis TaxID=363869 RepID=A0ABT0WCU7_9BACI|nr:site-specific integrase [Neobacillus pocheonensis]
MMIEEYIANLQKKNKSPKTIISYRNDIHIFLGDLHIHPAQFVTATDVRKWINSLLNPHEGKPGLSTLN